MLTSLLVTSQSKQPQLINEALSLISLFSPMKVCTLSNHLFIRFPGLRVSFSQKQTKIKNYNDSNTMLPLTSMPCWFGMVWIILLPLKSHCANVSKCWSKKTLILAYFTQCQTDSYQEQQLCIVNQSVLFFFNSFLLIDCNLHHADLHSQKQDSL